MSDVVYSEDRFESPTKQGFIRAHRERRQRNFAGEGRFSMPVADRGIDLRSNRPQGIDGYRAAYERQEAERQRLEAEKQKAVEKPLESISAFEQPADPQPPGLDGEPLYLIADILKEVSHQTGVSVEDIKSDRRTAFVIPARHIAMTLCKHLTLRSLPEIGRKIGMRDHTTVLHAVRKYEDVIAALVAKVPKGSSIAVWVAAFQQQLVVTPIKQRKPYTVKAIEQA